MRIIAIFLSVVTVALNLAAVLLVGHELLDRDKIYEGEHVIYFILFFAPLFTLVTLFVVLSENPISLYIKRKALEEKQKIDSLNQK